MARRPDTPCSGGCGTLLWSGRTSLPAGERTCRSCRSARRALAPQAGRKWRPTQQCVVCHGPFTPTRSSGSTRGAQLACSSACARTMRRGSDRSLWRRTERRCGSLSCLALVVAPRVYCAECSLERQRARYRRKNAVRRGAAGVGQMLTIDALGDRDRWRCHLCRRKVDRTLTSPHPMSPTFDHLVPISDGGTDDPANLRLAHRRCNSSRGAGGTVQLMLVG